MSIDSCPWHTAPQVSVSVYFCTRKASKLRTWSGLISILPSPSAPYQAELAITVVADVHSAKNGDEEITHMSSLWHPCNFTCCFFSLSSVSLRHTRVSRLLIYSENKEFSSCIQNEVWYCYRYIARWSGERTCMQGESGAGACCTSLRPVGCKME